MSPERWTAVTTDQASFGPQGLAEGDQAVFSDWKAESLQLREMLALAKCSSNKSKPTG